MLLGRILMSPIFIFASVTKAGTPVATQAMMTK
jgi:hypothetical protein